MLDHLARERGEGGGGRERDRETETENREGDYYTMTKLNHSTVIVQVLNAMILTLHQSLNIYDSTKTQYIHI